MKHFQTVSPVKWHDHIHISHVCVYMNIYAYIHIHTYVVKGALHKSFLVDTQLFSSSVVVLYEKEVSLSQLTTLGTEAS